MGNAWWGASSLFSVLVCNSASVFSLQWSRCIPGKVPREVLLRGWEEWPSQGSCSTEPSRAPRLLLHSLASLSLLFYLETPQGAEVHDLGEAAL